MKLVSKTIKLPTPVAKELYPWLFGLCILSASIALGQHFTSTEKITLGFGFSSILFSIFLAIFVSILLQVTLLRLGKQSFIPALSSNVFAEPQKAVIALTCPCLIETTRVAFYLLLRDSNLISQNPYILNTLTSIFIAGICSIFIRSKLFFTFHLIYSLIVISLYLQSSSYVSVLFTSLLITAGIVYPRWPRHIVSRALEFIRNKIRFKLRHS